MIKVYKASGYSLDKILSEVPENIEKNIISISHTEVPLTYKEYEDFDEYDGEVDEESDVELVMSDTLYKITIFYHE